MYVLLDCEEKGTLMRRDFMRKLKSKGKTNLWILVALKILRMP